MRDPRKRDGVIEAGDSTEGSFYEDSPGVPNGNDGVISPDHPRRSDDTHLRTELPRSGYRHRIRKQWGRSKLADHFEGQQNEVLEDYLENVPDREQGEPGIGYTWSPAGEELSNTNTVEGEAEIKG